MLLINLVLNKWKLILRKILFGQIFQKKSLKEKEIIAIKDDDEEMMNP